MVPKRQVVGAPPRGPSVATTVVQSLVEVPMGDHTKMVMGLSGGTFSNPVDIGPYIELGRSTEKPRPTY